MYTALKLTKKSLSLIAKIEGYSPERLIEILEQNPTVPCYSVLKDGKPDHQWLEEDYFLASYKFADTEQKNQYAEVVKI